jgi:MFS transporter, OFA family, oxalate/formate antiporter
VARLLNAHDRMSQAMTHPTDLPDTTTPPLARFGVVGAAILIMACAGSVYALSVFNQPLKSVMGWSTLQVLLPFESLIGCLALGGIVGGQIGQRAGVVVALVLGACLFGAGFCSTLWVTETHHLPRAVAGYAAAGIGTGIVYTSSMALAVRAMPHRKGFIAGLVAAGFGGGSAVVAPVLSTAMPHYALPTRLLATLGVTAMGIMLLSTIIVAVGTRRFRTDHASTSRSGLTLAEAVRTRTWWLLAGTLFFNILCGISLISVATDAFTRVGGFDAKRAGTLIALMAIANAAGRFGLASLSDFVGRKPVLVCQLLVQGVCLALVPLTGGWMTIAVGAIIYACYGGGFGVVPAASADAFGTRFAASVYGAMLFAWSLAGILGPLLVSVILGNTDNSYPIAFGIVGAIGALATCVPLLLPRARAAQS